MHCARPGPLGWATNLSTRCGGAFWPTRRELSYHGTSNKIHGQRTDFLSSSAGQSRPGEPRLFMRVSLAGRARLV